MKRPAKQTSARGRPPKGEERKGGLIRVRVTADQKRILTAAADAKGLDVSSWLRSLGLDAARELGTV